MIGPSADAETALPQVEFSHLDEGAAEERWAATGLASLPALAPPAAGDTLLVVAAHPDDEALGAGGLIATAVRAGARVNVVIASDGAASHPHSPTHTPGQLAQRRRSEADSAARALGLHAPDQGRVTWLGLPDGALGDHVEALAAALAGACPRPDLIVAPWLEDRHPDHAAATRAADQLAQATGAPLWQYPIWAWHWADPSVGLPARRLRRLALDPGAIAAKRAAIAAYVSQHRPLSAARGDEAVLSESMLAHFRRPFETFVVPAPAESVAYFDELYRESPDPWSLGTRWYERRKRDLLLAVLPRPRFRRVFEPGCALGHLTVRLAERADAVVAWDVSAGALEATRRAVRARGLDGTVSVQGGRIPVDWPGGWFDLIVISEVGYYCADLALLADRAASSLADDGSVVACHWRHPADDHPHGARAVHDALSRRLERIASYVDEDVLLDVFSRDSRSVARAEGIVPP